MSIVHHDVLIVGSGHAGARAALAAPQGGFTGSLAIGGGYIGLEAAAVMAKLGKKVCVVEALDRVLARVAGAPLSVFFGAEHRARGVDIRLGATVERIEGRSGRAAGVRLADGELIET